jgi:myo-inositol 2-dehydrogenase/D-chiro-inositol 1-dehydrogenase
MSPRVSNRRQFLSSSIAAAGTVVSAPYWLTARTARSSEGPSKNDRPQIALIGCGGRGSSVATGALELADIVAVCDVDRRQTQKAQERFPGRPTACSDFREVLARDDIDAIINATPDHWHTAINIAACQAGKDVYAEKPLTLTIEEGKLLRQVVEETGRVVQVGTQQRSDASFQTAVELVRNGRLGQLKQVWVAIPYFSTKGGPFAAEPIPPELDWDRYQGQAPIRDYCRQRTHGTFRWWYEYAGGIVTDWGNHHVDIAHWGMDCELTGPVEVDARCMFPNAAHPHSYNTADRFFSRMRYPNGLQVLYFSALGDRQIYGEVEGHQAMSTADVEWLFGTDAPKEVKTFDRNGIMFIGDEGRIFVNRGGCYGTPFEELKNNPLPEDRWRVAPSNNHMANFLQCMRSRQEPVSPVRVEHRTVTACHLTNISMRLNRPIRWDPTSEQIVDDSEANGWQKREQREPYFVRV